MFLPLPRQNSRAHFLIKGIHNSSKTLRTVLMTDLLNILSVYKDTELSNALSNNQMITTHFFVFYCLSTLICCGIHFMCHSSFAIKLLLGKEISVINQHEPIHKST